MRRLLMRIAAAGFALCVMAGPALASIQYNSDNSSTGFDATTAGSLPTGWTAIAGAWQASTAAALVPSHTNSFADVTKANLDSAIYTSGTLSGDLEVTATQVVTLSSGAASVIGLGVRYSSTGTSGYLCLPHVASGGIFTLQVFKKVAGTFTSIGTQPAAFTISGSSANVTLRMSVVGTSVRCKAWVSTSAEPASGATGTYTQTDSAVTGTGFASVVYGVTVAGQQLGLTDLTINDVPAGSANAIALTSPVPGAVGATISGAYAGTAPTGLGYALDGATSFTAITSPTIGAGAFSFAMPTASTNYHQMTVQATNLTTEVSATGAFQITGGAGPAAIAPNDAGLLYSPYNWAPNGATSAASINPGAYFKTLFTGASLVLNFDVSNASSPVPEIYYRIDGYEAQSPWTLANVASTITATLPTNTSAAPYHLLEVMIKSTNIASNRWNSPSNTAVVFTGLTLDSGAVVAAPARRLKNCLFYGDSITEGVRTVNQTAANTPDQNDALASWLYYVADQLNCEVGNIGFGGQGYTQGGVGNVPVITSSYNLIMAGVSRSFSPAPDLVIDNEGANDSAAADATVQADTTAFMGDLLAATPSSTAIVVLGTLPNIKNAPRQAAVTALGNARVSFVSTAGFFNTVYGSDTLSLHPTAANAVGKIAPQISAALMPILYPASGGTGSFIPHVGDPVDGR